MKKRKIPTLAAAILAAAMAVTGCSGTGRTETEPESQAEITAGPADNRPEVLKPPHGSQTGEGPAAYVDDFYDAVNHDTLESWEIPAEQADMSWFRKAREDNYSKVNDLIGKASSEAGQADQEAGSDLYNIRALNLTGLDRETRDREGYGRTAGAFLKEIDSADSVTGLLEACLRFQRNTGMFSLMGWYYGGDSEDSSVKVLYLSQPDTGLRREVWFSEDASNQKRVEEYKKISHKASRKQRPEPGGSRGRNSPGNGYDEGTGVLHPQDRGGL
ncbi:MAG: M13 family metallopeptidase [Clostridia bacterium]|nr:M13 family metallopeptidase [Clostridia bacterium]